MNGRRLLHTMKTTRDLVYELVKIAKQPPLGVGRYVGWHMVDEGPLLDWIRDNFDIAQLTLAHASVCLEHWSIVSGDPDDAVDFGVRLDPRPR